MEDELIKIWQSSPQTEKIKFEKSRLMLDMENSLSRINRIWKNMIIRETLASAICIPIFTYQAFMHPFTLTRIGSGLIVLTVVYIVFRLFRFKRQEPNNNSENYLDYLYSTREVLGIQKKALDNVVFWYVLPVYPGFILFLLGFVHIPEKTNIILFTFSLLIAMTIGAHYLNKWAAKKYYAPRLQKIDELIEVMESKY